MHRLVSSTVVAAPCGVRTETLPFIVWNIVQVPKEAKTAPTHTAMTVISMSLLNTWSVSNLYINPRLPGLPFYSHVAENCEEVAHFNEVSVFISPVPTLSHLDERQISNYLLT